jgi:zinc D-Ala-D-Ala carboxypeptidase
MKGRTRLSNNFTLEEMTKSPTAIRRGIDNTPNETQINNIKRLVLNVSQPVRDQFGKISTNSGFRCPELCEVMGSSKTSYHAFGMAHDLEPLVDGVSNLEVLIWIAENLEFTTLVAEYMSPEDPDAGWVHVSYDQNDLKGVIKIKDSTNNYTPVTLEDLKIYFKIA